MKAIDIARITITYLELEESYRNFSRNGKPITMGELTMNGIKRDLRRFYQLVPKKIRDEFYKLSRRNNRIYDHQKLLEDLLI